MIDENTVDTHTENQKPRESIYIMKITFDSLLSVIYIVRRSPNSNIVSANEKPL